MKLVKLLVSVILPNYNHALYLDERLNSIFNQTYQNIEVIILDDASTDHSLELLEVYRNHPKVSHFVVNKKNTGSPFKQWKKGLELAKGGIIWIAESDDFCDLDFLESQIKLLRDENIAVSVAKTIVVDSKGKKVKEARHHVFPEKDTENTLKSSEILKIPILNVSSLCFKAEIINQSVFFFANFNIIGDRVFYQEHFLSKFLTKNTTTNSYFRRHDNSVSNFNKKSMLYKKRFFQENLKFINYEYQLNHVDKFLFNTYLEKFFNKLRNHSSKKDKFSFVYFYIFMLYKFSVKY
jgi:glycosyltransferase involved in cell wall biosynthesis